MHWEQRSPPPGEGGGGWSKGADGDAGETESFFGRHNAEQTSPKLSAGVLEKNTTGSWRPNWTRPVQGTLLGIVLGRDGSVSGVKCLRWKDSSFFVFYTGTNPNDGFVYKKEERWIFFPDKFFLFKRCALRKKYSDIIIPAHHNCLHICGSSCGTEVESPPMRVTAVGAEGRRRSSPLARRRLLRVV